MGESDSGLIQDDELSDIKCRIYENGNCGGSTSDSNSGAAVCKSEGIDSGDARHVDDDGRIAATHKDKC